MLPASTRIMSADDHVIEPPHLWVDRVPARYRDDCPRIVEVEGRQAWLYEGEHVYLKMGSCLVDEHFAVRALGDIPVDNLLFEGDFPHGDGLWPNNRSYLETVLADVPDGDAVKIAETNLRGLLHAVDGSEEQASG